MPSNTTVTHAGERSVPINTTGHEKDRFTVCLAAKADGSKLKPFVVFKGVRQDARLLRFNGVVVAYSRNGWMNEELTKIWIEKIWGRLAFHRRLLVWDAYKCHIMDSVKKEVRQTGTDVSVIPGGLTSHLQPADVSWNKPFKEAYRTKYDEWLLSGEKSYTPSGNMRAPDKLLCLQWVKEAWNSISEEVVKKSFVACGISVEVDGSEDGKIHCLKECGIASDAAPLIADQTRNLHDTDEDNDPFMA